MSRTTTQNTRRDTYVPAELNSKDKNGPLSLGTAGGQKQQPVFQPTLSTTKPTNPTPTTPKTDWSAVINKWGTVVTNIGQGAANAYATIKGAQSAGQQQAGALGNVGQQVEYLPDEPYLAPEPKSNNTTLILGAVAGVVVLVVVVVMLKKG